MKTGKILMSVIVMLASTAMLHAGPPETEGKMIFMSRCAGCHNVNKQLTGPALAGVADRRSIQWITRFVNSPQTLIKGGDKDAVALFEKFKIVMPDHGDLTPDNIKSIVAYIKAETVIIDKSAPFAKPGKMETLYHPLSLEKNYVFFIIYLGLVALLIMSLLLAVRVKEFKINNQK
jgi:hypothetical protein